MCQRQRLDANTTHLAILIAILLQLIHVVQPQSQFATQSESRLPFHSQQKLPQAYVNGVLSLKGSLLANNLQLRPIIYSNSGEPSVQQMNPKQNFVQRDQSSDVESGMNMKPSQQSEETKQLLAETKQNFRELSVDLKTPQQQEEAKQQQVVHERDEVKDQLHQKLDQLQQELRKQDDQLVKQDLQLAQQVSSVTPSPLQQMPGPVHPPIEQLEVQSQGPHSVQTVELPQAAQSQPQVEPQSELTMSVRDAPPMAAQADGESNCYAKMQLLQQLAEYFGQSQPQQQQQQLQLQQQQHQQSQQQQPLRSNIAQLSPSDASSEEDDNEHSLDDAKTTEQCGSEEEATVRPTTKSPTPKVTAPTEKTNVKVKVIKGKEKKKNKTKNPKTKKIPCCTKRPKAKSSSQSPKEEQKDLQNRPHRHAMQPNLRIDAIATLLRYRNKQNDPSQAKLRESHHQQVDISKRRRKNKAKQKETKTKTRSQRRVITRKQMLQAEIKLWPIRISH